MSTMAARSGALPALVTAALVFAVGPSAAGTSTALGASVVADRRLDQPATATTRAAQSVMLAVAAAGKRIVAAGERGLVVHSDDCGAHWQQAQVPTGVTLVALTFVDDRRGWAVGHGGVVLATEDAGTTWRRQLDGRAIAQLALAAVKKTTADGGQDEAARAVKDAERLVADGPDKPLFGVHFWNSQRGMVVGAYGLALLTDDGGRSWRWIADRIPNPKGLHLYGLWAKGDQVYLSGEQGLLLRSDDGAARFKPVASPYAGSYFGLVPTPDDRTGDLLVYGLRGHAFRLSTQGVASQQLETGVQASILTALPGSDQQLFLFDGDGQVISLGTDSRALRSVSNSPVGPVVGATWACGNKVALAGFRGVAVVEPATLVSVAGKANTK